MCGLSNGTSVGDLKWPWRSFAGCRPFQVQFVKHLCSILPDFNWHRVRAVPLRQLGFLYQMLFSLVSKMVELKENEKWFSVSVIIYWRRFGLLSIFFDLLFFIVFLAVAYSQWWGIFSMTAKSIFINELNNGIIIHHYGTILQYRDKISMED